MMFDPVHKQRFQRSGGILMHPSSLPGPEGVGTLGAEAKQFVDFLAEGHQTLWQILPIGPTGYGDSPYQCFSAFAGNPRLISLDTLAEQGLLTQDEARTPTPESGDPVDYRAVDITKRPLLRRAFEVFRHDGTQQQRDAFDAFRKNESWWLDDYALFEALKHRYRERPWWTWPAAVRRRDGIGEPQGRLATDVAEQSFLQFLFDAQWMELRRYANAKGVRIIGDIPLYVAEDSADLWAQPQWFQVDHQGRPSLVAGVPPDFFSKHGQRWGNPVYNWEELKDDGFGWWIKRAQSSMQKFDILRIDHFRGLLSYWAVPRAKRTAMKGHWHPAPGHELLHAVGHALQDLPFIAEDLGDISQEVFEMRDQFGLPGMKILQYAFEGDPHSAFLPHNFERNSVAYTGTHDNDTMVGWWDALSPESKQWAGLYAGPDGLNPAWPFIRLTWTSVAAMAIAPMQDLLGLDNTARMNIPGTTSGNWQWRCPPQGLSGELAHALKTLSLACGR